MRIRKWLSKLNVYAFRFVVKLNWWWKTSCLRLLFFTDHFFLTCWTQMYLFLKILWILISWLLRKPSDQDPHWFPLWLKKTCLQLDCCRLTGSKLGRSMAHKNIQYDMLNYLLTFQLVLPETDQKLQRRQQRDMTHQKYMVLLLLESQKKTGNLESRQWILGKRRTKPFILQYLGTHMVSIQPLNPYWTQAFLYACFEKKTTDILWHGTVH